MYRTIFLVAILVIIILILSITVKDRCRGDLTQRIITRFQRLRRTTDTETASGDCGRLNGGLLLLMNGQRLLLQPVKNRQVAIGSNPETCDLVSRNEYVSSLHAVISYSNEGFYIQSEGRNHTWLVDQDEKGAWQRPRKLCDGEKTGLGILNTPQKLLLSQDNEDEADMILTMLI